MTCFICADVENNKCYTNCGYNVGGHCKYGVFENDLGDEIYCECDPEFCECGEGFDDYEPTAEDKEFFLD